LGLGPSAHSFNAQTGERWKNVSSLHKYANFLNEGKSPVEWTEELNDEQKSLEKWMLALRLSEGFPMTWLDTPLRKARAAKLIEERLTEAHPANPQLLRLTARGFALSDQIIKTLI